MYNKNSNNGHQYSGGMGFNAPNNGWANQGNQGTSQWGQANNWGGNNNNWGNNNQWGQPSKGGMGGIMGAGGAVGAGGATAAIAAGQKLVGQQKQTTGSLNNLYSNLVTKNQQLDTLRQSLQS